MFFVKKYEKKVATYPRVYTVCFKTCLKYFFSTFQCKKLVSEMLKTWYFPYSAFGPTSQWGKAIAPRPSGYVTAYAALLLF